MERGLTVAGEEADPFFDAIMTLPFNILAAVRSSQFPPDGRRTACPPAYKSSDEPTTTRPSSASAQRSTKRPWATGPRHPPAHRGHHGAVDVASQHVIAYPRHRRHAGSVPAVDLVLTASRPPWPPPTRSRWPGRCSAWRPGAHDLGSERDRTSPRRPRRPSGRHPEGLEPVGGPGGAGHGGRGGAPRHRRRPRADGGSAMARMRAGDPGPARPDDDPSRLRAAWRAGDAVHWVHLYDVLPGRSRIDATALSDAALVAWGETAARLGQALRGSCARGAAHDAVGRPARADGPPNARRHPGSGRADAGWRT